MSDIMCDIYSRPSGLTVHVHAHGYVCDNDLSQVVVCPMVGLVAVLVGIDASVAGVLVLTR